MNTAVEDAIRRFPLARLWGALPAEVRAIRWACRLHTHGFLGSLRGQGQQSRWKYLGLPSRPKCEPIRCSTQLVPECGPSA